MSEMRKDDPGEGVMVESRPATFAEEFYLRAFHEHVKTAPARHLDLLHKFVMMNIAMLGGALIGIREDLMTSAFRVVVLLALLASLAASLAGMLHRPRAVRLDDADGAREAFESAGVCRLFWLRASGIMTLAACAAAIVGVAARLA